MALPVGVEEGSAYHLVTPRTQRNGKWFRPAVLLASSLALACVVAATLSVGPSRTGLVTVTGGAQTGVSSEVPLELMPDPAEAVRVAQETTDQVDPFHRDGSWIVPDEPDDQEVPKLIMEPRYAMREGMEAADHASRQPYSVPLSRDGKPVPGNPVAALGQYTPKRQISNNPLAQFIPNITYWPNGDIVPFWQDECEPEDIECVLWKAKGYDNGAVVMPNPREHIWTDPWGLPLQKFGADPKEGTAEDPLLLGLEGIEKEEEQQGVPPLVAEADAQKVIEEVADSSGVAPEAAQEEAANAMVEQKVLEGTAEVAAQEKAAEENQEKVDELKNSIASIIGEESVEKGTAPQQEGVSMITANGPAGDLQGVATSTVQPSVTANVETISPVFKGPVGITSAIAQSSVQAGAVAGVTAAMQRIQAAQLQRAKVAGYLLKPMFTTV